MNTEAPALSMPLLYSYFRSSAVYRVRIALNIKGLPYEYRIVHLVKNGGEQRSPEYLAVNPLGLVPALRDKGELITQSLAIIEYLEDCHPQPPILPWHPADRAYVRSLAQQIASDIHPLNNLRLLDYLKNQLHIDEAQRREWVRHWMATGFAALEKTLAGDPRTGLYCFGNSVTLADICLVPQVFSARRWELSMDPYPTLVRIAAEAGKLQAFRLALPENQPDAE